MTFVLGGVDLGRREVLEALDACSRWLAAGPLDLTMDSELRLRVNETLGSYAECMRSRGVADFPDPVRDFNGVGEPFTSSRVPWTDPDLPAASDACRSLLTEGR